MSNHAMTMVWDAVDAPSDPGPMWVLVILADHGNDHGGEDYRCWPSVERVMERSKFKRSACEGHLKTLVALGWISRRRRVRPDGRKTIYDYEIHRDAAFRAELRQARAAIAAAGLKVSGEAVDARHPCVNSTHGPCVETEPAMREIHAQPCVKSTHLEPVREPLEEEPSPGERALRARFDDLVSVVPKRTLKFAQIESEAWPAFRQAVEAGVVAPEVLIDCGRRMAADPELKGRRYLPPLETWLTEGQWRSWLPDDEPVAAEPEAAPAPGLLPAGEVGPWMRAMAAAQAAVTPGEFTSWIARAALGQIGEELVMVAATGMARDWIRARCWAAIEQAWAAADEAGRPLALMSKSEFEARLRHVERNG